MKVDAIDSFPFRDFLEADLLTRTAPMRCFALILLMILAAAPLRAEPLTPMRRLAVPSDFDGKTPGKTARDVSGLACMPVPNGQRRCLLINDESAFAQFATLAENGLEAGGRVDLLGGSASPQTLGTAPSGICDKPGRFAELDGEAVTYAAGAFYVAGSHGCSRRRGEFRLSAFHLARLRVDAGGAPSAAPELSYRLSDMLRRAGEAAPFFGRRLGDQNGMNVEGIAVTGGTLWAGLRAPSLRGEAFLVGASVEDLFRPGHDPAMAAPRVVTIPAGEDRGIRDLAALADGRLLALVGPAQEQDLPYALLLVDPDRPETAQPLGELPRRKTGKAESLTVIEQAGDRLHLLIGYDGPRNGGFERYDVTVPR